MLNIQSQGLSLTKGALLSKLQLTLFTLQPPWFEMLASWGELMHSVPPTQLTSRIQMEPRWLQVNKAFVEEKGKVEKGRMLLLAYHWL